MSNVINLFADELKHCSYYEKNDEVGVAMLDKSLMVIPLNVDEFELVINGLNSYVFDRAELAEFLHVAAVCIDSEQRYLPKVDLCGRNYKGE